MLLGVKGGLQLQESRNPLPFFFFFFSTDYWKAAILWIAFFFFFFHSSPHYEFLSPDNPIILHLKPLTRCLEELFLEPVATALAVSFFSPDEADTR